MKSTRLITKILLFWAFEVLGYNVYSQIVTIDLIKGCETNGTIRLSDIADKIDYVKLETTKDCLVGHTDLLYSYKDDWFIRMSQILRFDKNGKFLNRISGRGKGPGEFIELSGVGFNTKNDHIYVINRLTGMAMEFSLDGKLIGNIKTKSSMSVPFNNQYFVNYFWLSTLFLSQGYRLTVVSFDGKIQKKLLKQDLSKLNGNIHMGFVKMVTYHDSITCFDNVTDTMYRMDSDLKVNPRYILNFGKETLPFYIKVPGSSPEYRNEIDTYSFVMSFVESDGFLFFGVLRKGKYHKVVYNKTNGACFSIDEKVNIINDIDPGCNFWPLGSTDDGRLYCLYEVYGLKETFSVAPSKNLPGEKEKKTLKNMVENSKEDDNPILVIVTPKK